MFSNITEAWHHNPVNEMTNKLKNGSFQDKTSQTNLYNFKQKQKSNQSKCTTNLINLSDTSLNLLSETEKTDQSLYSPIKFSKDNKSMQSMDFDEFETGTNSEVLTPLFDKSDTRCTYNVRHLSKCKYCHKQLNKLINRKVKEKISDILLYDRLNQIKTLNTNSNKKNYRIPESDLSLIRGLSDTWKETLIIIVGAVIAIFIIYLATKSFP